MAQLGELERTHLGTKYTEPAGVWEALRDGESTVLLRASRLRSLQHGSIIPKRGDLLPPDAFIGETELRRIYEAALPNFLEERVKKFGEHFREYFQNSHARPLPVIAISHFWRTK